MGGLNARVVDDIPDGSVAMTEHAVVVAGGGPTGMMLAAELALAKVDVAVLERRPDHVLVGSRAGGFHSRTIEVLEGLTSTTTSAREIRCSGAACRIWIS
jgi:2-polyprenyl-6-methoxyphenol hydroxylase-like FAD-dependent oxidoreductase